MRNIIGQLTGGSLSACVLETALDLFTGLGSTPDSTGTWNDDSATGALTGSIFNPSAVGAGTYNLLLQTQRLVPILQPLLLLRWYQHPIQAQAAH